MTEFPEFAEFGYLNAFDVDLKGQRISLETDGVMVRGREERFRLKASFESVFYAQIVGDIPIVFGENEVHEFYEQIDPELQKQFDARDGWLFFASKVGSYTLGSPLKPHPVARGFYMQSAFMGAEWMCTKASFELAVMEWG